MVCTVLEMIDKFDVEPSAAGECTLRPLSGGRGITDGHQFLAQVVVATSRMCAEKCVHSAQLQFSRVANESSPAELTLTQAHDGHSFSSVGVEIRQSDKLCARGQVLLGRETPALVNHCTPFPSVATAAQSNPLDMPVSGREIRLVENIDLMDPAAPAGSPLLHAWVRYDTGVSEQCLEQALLAHFTGHLGIATALKPHPGMAQSQAHTEFMSGILAIDVVFHRRVNAADWMLFKHDAVSVARGLAYIQGQVFAGDQGLIASFNQQAILRHMPDNQAGTKGKSAQETRL